MAGATRPVQGGAYSSPRSEPGGQNTPRAGRVVASYGTYSTSTGLFWQQVDQGLIFDDTADSAAIVTADGTGVEVYAYDYTDANSGTATAAGTATDTYVSSEVGTATLTATGTATDTYVSSEVGTATLTATGTGTDTYGVLTYYDTVIDADNPVSHWKLGDPTSAPDRKGSLNLPALGGPIGTTPGLIQNNASSSASVLAQTGQAFTVPNSTGIGAPYNTATWTVEAWFKRSAAVSMTVVEHTSKAAIFVFAGRFSFYGFDASGTNKQIDSVAPLGTVGTGVTHHVALTYDGTNLIAYIDSTEAGRLAMTGSNSVADSAPKIRDMDGVIDEVAWYPTALTAARILAHYQAGTIPAGTVYTDTGSGTLTASGTATETAAYTDSGTAPLTATGTGTETRSYTDTATGTATATGTGTDSWTTSTSYTDSQSGAITSSGTGTETAAGNDTTTGTATTAGSSTEAHADTATASGTTTTSGTGTDAASTADAQSGTITTTGTGTDTWTRGYQDAGTGTTTASGTSTETQVHDDTATGTLTATGSGLETHADTGTGTATLTASGTGLEAHSHADSTTGSLTLTGTGSDDYQLGATTYTDTAAGTLTASGAGLGAHASSDSATGPVTASGAGLESYLPGPTVHTDTGSGTVTSTGTGAEAYSYTDTTAGATSLTGTGLDTWGRGYQDTATGSLTTAGSGLEDRTYTDSTLGLALITGTGVESTLPRQLAISTITLNQPTYNIAIQNGNMATTLTATAAPTIRIIATPSITTSIKPPAPIAVELERIT